MPVYNCNVCKYSSTLKSNFERHNKSNKHRNKITAINIVSKEHGGIIQNNPAIIQNNPAIIQNNPAIIQHNPANKKFKCDYCEKEFTLHANKRRHELHRCTNNPEFIDKIIGAKNSKIKALELSNEKLEREKKELYKQVSKLLDKVGDTNIQNNIILNNYGNEDISHITDKVKTTLLGIPYCAIPKMIEAIHFNDEKPENKNIMITNKKDNLVKVFEGDKWVYKNKNETITDLVDSKYTIIDEHYDELEQENKVNPHIKTTFQKFRKFYDAKDAEMVEKLRKECELVLLNNR